MCGIAGIYSYRNEAPPVDREELLRIRERMHNRGPDGAGLWISDDQKVGLAHRRLSIIDLSEAGAQPMLDGDTGNLIVFNGEIYNYLALRKELEAAGQRFRSHSDTEVLLKLYEQHGAAMVHKLRGMYAIALWDVRKQGLFLARDPFGIKPLYLADNGKTLRFASQVKALLTGGAVDTQPEPAGHAGFFLWGHVPEPFTLFKGIRAFPAGTSLWIDRSGRKKETRFFDLTEEFARPAAQVRPLDQAEAREYLRAALLDSVRHHLVSDVPVGLFLSAGLDSANLLGLASECLPAEAPPNTLTLAFREFIGTPNDEAPLAEALARHYGAQHRTQWVQRQDFTDQLDALLDAMDQPSIDGVNSYFVCKAAREAGLKVALSGLGGDELFAGYSHFQGIPRMVRWLKPFAALPWLGRSARYLSAPLLRHTQRSPKAAGLLEYGGSTAGAYLLRRGLSAPWELERLLDREFAREGWQALQTLPVLNTTIQGLSTDRARISALETRWYMQNQLLRDTDWAGMTHGVEVRTPLVDVELFRAVQSLVGANFPVGKLEMATTPLRSIPLAVLERKKTGFSVPVSEWTLGFEELDTTNQGKLNRWAIRVYRKFMSQPTSDQAYDQAQFCFASRTPYSLKLGLLASEVTTRGGIQSFMLRITEVMHDALKNGAATETSCISLNDSTNSLRNHPAMPQEIDVWGAQRSKVKLVIHTLFKMPRKDVLFVGHIGLSPISYWLKKLGKVGSYHVILHGIEAWRSVSAIERRALMAATSLIATTGFTARECANYNEIPPSQFHVIPLCADESHTTPSPTFKLNGEFKLLCVARQDASEQYKGFENIFQALAKLQATQPNIHLNMVGTGNDQVRLKSVVDEIGLSQQVTFWGALSDEDLVAAYRDCDVYVMPSKNEGFGIVFLEAMRWGKPCIGGNNGGTPEVIEHGVDGYIVDYGDIEALAYYICQLSCNQNLRHVMGERARITVAAKFSKSLFFKRYTAIINQGVVS